MKHSSLIAFLDGELSPSQFSDEIAAEVDECAIALKTTGHGRIFVTDGPETILTRARARRLLVAVADQILSSDAASYVADCIIMGHTFEWEDEMVGEAVHFLADGDNRLLPATEIRGHLLGLG
jgi:hypothetical protein